MTFRGFILLGPCFSTFRVPQKPLENLSKLRLLPTESEAQVRGPENFISHKLPCAVDAHAASVRTAL